MTSLKVLYYRQTFATNSSSDHNVVLLPGGATDHDFLGEDEDGRREYRFGWQEFVAGSRDAKLHYLALAALDPFERVLGGEAARRLLAHTLGLPSHEFGGYLDHQSLPCLPSEIGKEVPRIDFLLEMKRLLECKDVVIIGGNDNSPPGEGDFDPSEDFWRASHAKKGVALSFNADSGDPHVARREADHWLIFNTSTGAKIRFRFEATGGVTLPRLATARPRAPELIDVKITDYCERNCNFCYQGSTPEGQHCDLREVRHLAHYCQAQEVFEVSLGGGEPTKHPQFLEILETFREFGVVPNFTTATLGWAKKPQGQAILEACGAFALTVGHEDDDEELLAFRLLHSRKAQANLVMGHASLDRTLLRVKHLDHEDVPITLLGWKTPRRERTYARKEPYAGWVKRLRDLGIHRIGLDTALAVESREELEAAGALPWTYDTREGHTSMYIDLVTKQCAPCSYTPPEQMIPYRWLGHAWEQLGPKSEEEESKPCQ